MADKPFIVRLYAQNGVPTHPGLGRLVANSRVVIFNDNQTADRILNTGDITDSQLQASITSGNSRVAVTYKTFVAGPPFPTPSIPVFPPAPPVTPLPTPPPTPIPTPAPLIPEYSLLVETSLSIAYNDDDLSTTVWETPGYNTVFGNLQTKNVSDGTVFNWSISPIAGSNITAGDVTFATGTFNVNDDYGLFQFDITPDLTLEENEFFSLDIRLGSLSGPMVAQETILVVDTSIPEFPTITNLTITPNPANETDKRVVTVSYTITDGAARDYYWAVEGFNSTTADDFIDDRGTLTSSRGTKTETFYVFINQDSDVESNESFRVNFYMNAPYSGVPFEVTPVVTLETEIIQMIFYDPIASATPGIDTSPGKRTIKKGDEIALTFIGSVPNSDLTVIKSYYSPSFGAFQAGASITQSGLPTYSSPIVPDPTTVGPFNIGATGNFIDSVVQYNIAGTYIYFATISNFDPTAATIVDGPTRTYTLKVSESANILTSMDLLSVGLNESTSKSLSWTPYLYDNAVWYGSSNNWDLERHTFYVPYTGKYQVYLSVDDVCTFKIDEGETAISGTVNGYITTSSFTAVEIYEIPLMTEGLHELYISAANNPGTPNGIAFRIFGPID